MAKRVPANAHIYFGSFMSYRNIETVRVPLLEGHPVLTTHLYTRGDTRALCGVSLTARQHPTFTTVECKLCWWNAKHVGPDKHLMAPRWKPYAYGERWSFRFAASRKRRPTSSG